MFTSWNKSIKPLLATAALLALAISGCDAQEQEATDVASVEVVEEDLDPADPFQVQEEQAQEGEFRSANVCQAGCRKAFSACLSSCSFNPRHGFELAQDERCLARCEHQLSKCLAGCNKPNPGAGRITVQGPCFSFNATASGGLGGFRVYGAGEQKFHRFNPRTSGRICTGSGKKVRFEVSKLLDPSISVNVNVQGKNFSFPGGHRGDRLLNSWYRKFFDVYVK